MNIEYLRKFHKDSLAQCDRCGILDMRHNIVELKGAYKKEDLTQLCRECGDVANSFVNYYGEKSDKDVSLLNDYLVSGDKQVGIFNAKMNGGYGVVV